MRIAFLLIITLCCLSCGQKSKRSDVVNPVAKKLTDSAVNLREGQYEKAVALLDEATRIDSNYFPAYYSKLNFQAMIKPFNSEKIIAILNKLCWLRRDEPDYPMKLGMLYLKSTDTIPSTFYLQEAMARFDRILDTMQATTGGYDMFVINKAVTLVLLGNEKMGQTMLANLYAITKDDVVRGMLKTEMTKSRKEVLAGINFE
jgi:tetratricopeptide (TPR) repeat protein